MNRLRQAEGRKQKEEARNEVLFFLEDYFDQDMKRRFSEIALLEQQVKGLRDQCEQRQQAKQEILQLELKRLEHKAAGLGFFGQ